MIIIDHIQMNKLPTHIPYNQHSLKTHDYPLQINIKTHYQTQSKSVQPLKMLQTIDGEILKVMEPHEYSKMQTVLSTRLKNVIENINVCRQKNHLKDREVQSNVGQIDKLETKIKKLEERTVKREKQLHKISIKCKELFDCIHVEEEKAKKELVYNHQEDTKCQALEEQISEVEKEIRLAQNELERRQKLTENVQEKQQEQQKLQEILSRLMNNQKMIEYQANNEKSQCLELEKKMEHLKKVLKDRTHINKSNTAKLAKLNKEIHNLQIFIRNKQNSTSQIKNMELELGQLNQELLLINEDISELNFKILRKKQAVAHFRTKNEASRMQMSTLTNQTPTFPSKQLFSEKPSKVQNEQTPNQTEALKNIEKLINRYQRIKSKDEQKY